MKREVKNADDLARAIEVLELKAAAQKRDIQDTFKAVSENLKPFNLVKSGVKTIFSGEYKEDLLNGLMGLGTGFLSRKLLLGRSKGLVGKTVGKAVQWGMAGLVSNNADKIKEKASEIIDKIFRKKKDPMHISSARPPVSAASPPSRSGNYSKPVSSPETPDETGFDD